MWKNNRPFQARLLISIFPLENSGGWQQHPLIHMREMLETPSEQKKLKNSRAKNFKQDGQLKKKNLKDLHCQCVSPACVTNGHKNPDVSQTTFYLKDKIRAKTVTAN